MSLIANFKYLTGNSALPRENWIKSEIDSTSVFLSDIWHQAQQLLLVAYNFGGTQHLVTHIIGILDILRKFIDGTPEYCIVNYS